MHRYRYPIHLLALLPALLLAGQSHDELAGKPALDILDADRQLPNTRVIPTLDAEHEKGKNLLYCATFQLAWNELMELLDGPLDLENKPPAAAKLNNKNFTPEMLDKESYFIFAGGGPTAHTRMAEELKTKFGGAASPKLLPRELGPNEFVAYSYLYKNLKFSVPLYSYPNGFEFSGGNVKTFGIATDNPLRGRMLRYVRVHDYVNKDDFVIELTSKSPDDSILIAKIPPGKSLQKSTESVLQRLQKTNRDTLESGEDLRIPTFNFEVVKNYSDLAPLKLYKKSWDMPGQLKECTQLIRFKFDEFGAIVKSETRIRGAVGQSDIDDAPAPPPPPRHFICDRPFLVLLLHRNKAKPYFALWVDNSELLVKSDAKPDPPAPKEAKRPRTAVGLGNIDD